MVNSNPETVSTDYDTSDRLYLEPLTEQDVLDVCELERPVGVAVSYGGQTPLRLAPALAAAGVPLLGDPLDAIDAAEDRGRFAADRGRPGAGVGRRPTTPTRRATIAERIGYPVLVRPHHVLGGRGMHVARSADELRVDGPCLVDRYLEGALELDVDALCDGEDAWVAAMLEHVEPAGVHSGDSACVLPGPSVTRALEAEIREVAARDRPRPRRARPAQPPARAARRPALRARGEPARVADGAVRREGDGRAARRALGAAAARRAARRARPARAGGADARVGEGGGLPVGALPGRGDARARDALDRRGDGRRATTAVEAYRARAPRGRAREARRARFSRRCRPQRYPEPACRRSSTRSTRPKRRASRPPSRPSSRRSARRRASPARRW